MDISCYKKYEPIDGKWYITKELGSGAFGSVFEVERKDFSNMKSAMKIISIPGSQTEVNNYRSENYDLDEKSVTSYFYGFVEEFIKEFQIMSQLRGNGNIVSIEDYEVKEKDDGFGWDIFIRMELLTPMNDYFKENSPKQSDVIKLGIDMCKALEICQKYKIIHRDIKPSNIFVSDSGDFKLGDFGVARTLEKTSSGLSKKGTYTYMAPEIFKGEEYGSNVDIYSLGIVMYKLCNNNLEPFRKERTYSDGEQALALRIKGEKIPKPANADGRLAEIILKACAFEPKDRYESPIQMREELESILYTENEEKLIFQQGDKLEYEPSDIPKKEDKTIGLFDEKKKDVDEEFADEPTRGIFDEVTPPEDDNKTPNEITEEEKSEKTRKLPWKGIIAICSIFILVIFVAIWGATSKIDKNVLKERDMLKIGYTVYPPIAFYKNDRLIGFDVELAEYVCTKLGIIPEFVEIKWDEKKEKLEQKYVDCVWNGFDWSPEREEEFLLSDIYASVHINYGENGDDSWSDDDWVIAFDKRDTELASKINAVLSEAKEDGTINRLADKYEITLRREDTDTTSTSKDQNDEEVTTDKEETKKQDTFTAPQLETYKSETCSICGSSRHKAMAHCSVCKSTEHVNHPTCATCGSTTHTIHKRCPVDGEFHTRKEHPCCPECKSPFHAIHTFFDYKSTLGSEGITYWELDRSGNVIREVLFEW